MKFIFIFLLLMSNSLILKAGTDDYVQLRGKVSNIFDKYKVKVVTDHNQTFFIDKVFFPKDFKFQEGNYFEIEITEKEFNQLKLK